ncbi:PF06127 family protein [Caballeronia cordobensis]|uniref:PF06127 family protein n=1 Tax=Caballeronia cordobensis TaxID=1353886 RepID=A0A158IPH2_CABCO|nr:Mpo1-like protein [Caballeronia cordobensis]SAL58435.1 PF06127 family protein [Caballeronia cordobensis]
MRTLTDQLSQYAAYHRDRRNIATHFVGIPLIVLAIAALLSRPAWPVLSGAFMLTPACVLFALATLYYLWLDVPLGIAMGIVSAASAAFGRWAASQVTSTWLAIGIGFFVIGWVFQFVGHVRYEHRKPAFVDDIIGLLIGPLFILIELLFGLGLMRGLRDAIDARAVR